MIWIFRIIEVLIALGVGALVYLDLKKLESSDKLLKIIQDRIDNMDQTAKEAKEALEVSAEAIDTANTAAKVADTSAKAVLGVRELPEVRKDMP